MLVKVYDGDYYSNNVSSVSDWIDKVGIDSIIGCTNPSIYDDYINYCEDNNIKLKVSHVRLTKFLCENYNLGIIIRKVKGKSFRILVKKTHS